ncbi:MAG: hypothetical protein QOE64_2119, partial [Frankiales bacterium]|nr:hypothetical protein [Frankiales bacterium]
MTRSRAAVRLVPALLALMATTVAAIGLLPRTAQAATDVWATVVDAHDHVFQSFGRNESTIAVRDISDGTTTVIEGQYGASGMALSADGSQLYVALAAGDAISVIDTTSLTELRRVGTGTASCPSAVAETPGRAWFIDSCVDGGDGHGRELRSVDLGTEPAVVSPTATPVNNVESMVRLTDTRLALWGNSADFWVVDATEALTPVPTKYSPGAGELTSILPRHDGSGFFLGGALQTQEWSLPEPTFTRTVRDGWSGRLALTGDDSLLLSGDTTYGSDGPHRSIDQTIPQSVGRAFTGDVLILVGWNGQVTRLTGAGLYATSLVIQYPGVLPINQEATFHGTLISNGPALGAGREIVLSRVVGSTVTAMPSVLTAADGTFSFTDTPTVRGARSYRADWQPDSTHLVSPGQVSVAVRGLTTPLTVTADHTAYKVGQLATLTAHTASDRVNKTVYFSGSGISRSCNVNSSGVCSVAVTFTRNTYLYVSTPADSLHEAGSSSYTSRVFFRIDETVLDAYSTTSAGSYFHAAKSARMAIDVHQPNGQ